MEFDATDDAVTSMVTDAVESIVVSFVVLHEVYHILAGHLNVGLDDEPSRGHLYAVRESSLGFSAAVELGTPIDVHRLRRCYYQEHEADNSALQCLMQLPVLEPVADLIGAIEVEDDQDGTPARPCEMTGIHQLVMFRLLAASSWLIVQLVEFKRNFALRKSFDEYPLSSARLLSALSTLLEEFAGLSVTSVDASGAGFHTLSDEGIAEIRRYLPLVLKPLAVHLPATTATGQTASMLELCRM